MNQAPIAKGREITRNVRPPVKIDSYLDDALEKLSAMDARKAKLVELRFFSGLTTEQAADVLDVSIATAERDWAYARAWLRREVSGEGFL